MTCSVTKEKAPEPLFNDSTLDADITIVVPIAQRKIIIIPSCVTREFRFTFTKRRDRRVVAGVLLLFVEERFDVVDVNVHPLL